MTSMIDVLVVLTVFLLITFEASPECHATGRTLPVSETAELSIVDAPSVDVRSSGMYFDGIEVGSVADLGTKLKARREWWKALHPGKTMPPNIALAMDPETSSATVKAIVKTAAENGYPSIDFIVLSR
jgi:biopolymer transport protein ExbD